MLCQEFWILLNLLDNAIKFTEKGRIVVECRLHDEFFSIRVTDTGIGIKAEDMDKLFQPFRQIDDSRTRRYEGTGLGLSICKRLANLLGGTIQAESIWVKGSSFTFTAPTGNGMVTQGKTKAEMGNRPIAVPVASVLP